MAYAQSLEREARHQGGRLLLAHPAHSLSVGQTYISFGEATPTGVGLVTRLLSIPAVKRTGFFGDLDKQLI